MTFTCEWCLWGVFKHAPDVCPSTFAKQKTEFQNFLSLLFCIKKSSRFVIVECSFYANTPVPIQEWQHDVCIILKPMNKLITNLYLRMKFAPALYISLFDFIHQYYRICLFPFVTFFMHNSKFKLNKQYMK